MTYRVLVASDFYPPVIGGAELQTQMLARGLARRGHAVTAVTNWQVGLPRCQRDVGFKVTRLRGTATRVPWFSSDPARRFHPPVPDPGVVLELRGLIREFQPQVVHACGWIAFSCAAALHRSHIPLVVSVRDYGYSCAIRTLMHDGRQVCSGPGLRKCLACAAGRYGWLKAAAAVPGVLGGQHLLRRNRLAVVCVSRYVESIVRRDLLQDHTTCDVLTIPDIVGAAPEDDDTHVADEQEQRVMSQLPREPFILFVGALQAAKGVHVLLDAYDRLTDPPPLVLMGTTWPESPTTFPRGVTLFRNVPHAAVMRAWARSLFGVVPSTWPDPLPGTVREAMSQGKPVIGSAVGGIVDMVHHGQNGLLVPASDVDALSTAMQSLIDDPGLREQFGVTARADVDSFREAAILPRFEKVYERMIGAGLSV
jgi:glycosyltransferase involved in cell wall biosynthesis